MQAPTVLSPLQSPPVTVAVWSVTGHSEVRSASCQAPWIFT